MSDLDTENGGHSEYLNKVYEMAKGKMSREIDLSQLSRGLDIDIVQAQKIGLALDAEGLVTLSAGEYVRLTNKGIQEVEKELGPRQQQSWWGRLFRKNKT